MFELEFINLINEYKKSSDSYEKNNLKISISNLIKQNSQKYQEFLQLQPLDEQTKELLQNCEKEIENIENQKHQDLIDTKDDFEIIKSYYYKWLEIYKLNNKEINEENKKIVKSIIEHYANHRFQILEKIFNLDDDENFESFKWHIKNELRIYFLNKIKEYLNSSNYNEFSFFAKKRKKIEIDKLLDELGEYKFNPKKIKEVLE